MISKNQACQSSRPSIKWFLCRKIGSVASLTGSSLSFRGLYSVLIIVTPRRSCPKTTILSFLAWHPPLALYSNLFPSRGRRRGFPVRQTFYSTSEAPINSRSDRDLFLVDNLPFSVSSPIHLAPPPSHSFPLPSLPPLFPTMPFSLSAKAPKPKIKKSKDKVIVVCDSLRITR